MTVPHSDPSATATAPPTFRVGDRVDGAGWTSTVAGGCQGAFGSFYQAVVVEATTAGWIVQCDGIRYAVTREGLQRRDGAYLQRLVHTSPRPGQ